MKNRRGFTLVELIAVVVILIFLMLLGVSMANKHMENTKLNVFLKEANTFARGALQKESAERELDVGNDDIFHGLTYGKVCYSVKNTLFGKYVSKTNNKYEGSVEVCYGVDCTYQTKVWITDGKHYINGVSNPKEVSQIDSSFTVDYPYTCGVKAIGGGTGGTLLSSDFDYVGSEQVLDISIDGVYALEAWGAQGGAVSPGFLGGYGAYAYAEVKLKRGDRLYINVGQEGTGKCVANDDPTCRYSYNGGYKGNTTIPGGGGATHIAKKSGKIYENISKNDFYIVAAGGAGEWFTGWADNNDYYYNQATKHGGAYCNYTDQYGHVGCQTGHFGADSPGVYGQIGDGGGIYNFSDRRAGGQSYAHNPVDKNAALYCYGCYVDTANVATHKSYLTNDVSDVATAKYAKIGNGFARITYIENFTE